MSAARSGGWQRQLQQQEEQQDGGNQAGQIWENCSILACLKAKGWDQSRVGFVICTRERLLSSAQKHHSTGSWVAERGLIARTRPSTRARCLERGTPFACRQAAK